MLLDNKNDIIIMIDMINGFSYEGAFASENIVALIPKIRTFIVDNLKNNVKVIHYTDSHIEGALEFNSYPIHCLANTSEAQPVSQLDFKEIEIIKKNSTNGFMAKNPFDYARNLYIVGCVTDICIFEFALSVRKFKEEFNLPYTVNVIEDLVATFDAPNHDATLVHDYFINSLRERGVKIIKTV